MEAKQNKRVIKFRAWVQSIQTMLHDIALYPSGNIGLSDDDFVEQLNPAYEWDGEEVRTKISEDGMSGHELALTTLIGDEYLWIEPEATELMQFTGLHDKDGVEIYEGDVVKVSATTMSESSWTATVEWGLMGFGLSAITTGGMRSKGSLYGYYGEPIKVIGNIYQISSSK